MEKFQHGGQIYDAQGAAGKFLDFSANINPFGLSEKILSALEENLRGVVNYPDAQAAELKNAISRRYKVQAENLILLNGAAEFFYLCLQVMRPRKVLIPVPSFSEYERAARAARLEVEYFFLREDEDFRFDTEKILSRNADCVILGRPNNPTGNLIALEDVLKLAEKFFVVVDESFIDFLEIESVRRLVGEKITVVQSLTKIFAIPGLRLGFAVAEKNLAEKLNAAKDVWNVNFLAQKAGVAAFSDEKFLADTKAWLAVEKKYFAERLKKLPGVKIFQPSVNFILFCLQSKETAAYLLKKLRAEKILLRSCENFVGLDGRFLRSAIRSRAENILLLDAMQKILEVEL